MNVTPALPVPLARWYRPLDVETARKKIAGCNPGASPHARCKIDRNVKFLETPHEHRRPAV